MLGGVAANAPRQRSVNVSQRQASRSRGSHTLTHTPG